MSLKDRIKRLESRKGPGGIYGPVVQDFDGSVMWKGQRYPNFETLPFSREEFKREGGKLIILEGVEPGLGDK